MRRRDDNSRRGANQPTPARRRPDGVPEPRTRKPYAAPILEPWGTLVDITRKVGAKGQRDGAVKGPRNTRL
jgi:hypothetical protein